MYIATIKGKLVPFDQENSYREQFGREAFQEFLGVVRAIPLRVNHDAYQTWGTWSEFAPEDGYLTGRCRFMFPFWDKGLDLDELKASFPELSIGWFPMDRARDGIVARPGEGALRKVASKLSPAVFQALKRMQGSLGEPRKEVLVLNAGVGLGECSFVEKGAFQGCTWVVEELKNVG